MITQKTLLALAATTLVTASGGGALAQPVRPNILIVFDTSGSMTYYNFNNDRREDGSEICGASQTKRRIEILRTAIREALAQVGTDEANFGLARFPQVVNPNITPVCPSGYYTATDNDTGIDNPNPGQAVLPGCRISTQNRTTPETTFGPWFRNGIRQSIVVDVTRTFDPAAGPSAADFDPLGANIATIATWLDGKEVLQNGVHTNPEIRAGPQGTGGTGLPAGTSGAWATPLGRSLLYSRLYFDNFIKPQDSRSCRKNLVILVTDGEESCDRVPDNVTPTINLTNCQATGYPALHPVVQACQLYRQSGVSTYVLTDSTLVAGNNPIASAGGTGSAIGVSLTNADEIKSALVRIIAESVPPPETCNGIDDDCDGQTDEGPLTGVGTQCNCGGLVTPEQDGKGACTLGTNVCKGAQGIQCEGCVGPSNELCNNLDDNCNGQVDETFERGGSCNNGQVGVCRRVGNLVCTPDGTGVTCDAQQVTPGAEICNLLDDDCNGQTDEGLLPGVGGVCGVDLGECTAGKFRCEMGKLSCDQARTPGETEACNGLDDDCDGQTDEGLTLGMCACDGYTMEQLMVGECRPGTQVCRGSLGIRCEGCLLPRPSELCDLKDNDCDGLTDEGDDLCNAGWICLQGECELKCRDAEFPCPVGFGCDDKTTPPICRSLKCATKRCQPGFVCDEGDGECKDPCIGVTCQAPQMCIEGRCQDCRTRPSLCTADEVCSDGLCRPNPCATISCGEGQYCDNGQCVGTCGGQCPAGQRCLRGACQVDACTNVVCPLGQVCDPSNGSCQRDMCLLKACPGQLCVQLTGECKDDPCASVKCPTDGCWQCRVASDGAPLCANLGDSCKPPSRSVTIRTGGGGCSCAVPGSTSPAAPPATGLLSLFALGALVLGRRRSRRRSARGRVPSGD